MKTDNSHIEQLKRKLEEQYDMGPSMNWTHTDYEMLSNNISSKSKIPLSSSTLKRIFGKISSSSNPSLSSLNAISIYLGYEGWHSFCKLRDMPKPTKVKWVLKVLLLFIFLTIGFALLNKLNSPGFVSKQNLKRKFTFETPDTIGFSPHKIQIRLDLEGLKGGNFRIKHPETGFINIEKTIKFYSLYVRKPGIIKVSLYQYNTVLKTLTILIQSDDWCSYVTYKNNVRHYYVKNVFTDSSFCLLEDIFPPTENSFFSVNYMYAKNTDLSLENFTAIARLRLNENTISDNCNKGFVSLYGRHAYVSIPFAHPSCNKDQELMLPDTSILVSNIPMNFNIAYEWQELKISKKSDSLRIYMNNEVIISAQTKLHWGYFQAVKFAFTKNKGEIDYFRFFDTNDSLIYSEEFNK